MFSLKYCILNNCRSRICNCALNFGIYEERSVKPNRRSKSESLVLFCYVLWLLSTISIFDSTFPVGCVSFYLEREDIPSYFISLFTKMRKHSFSLSTFTAQRNDKKAKSAHTLAITSQSFFYLSIYFDFIVSLAGNMGSRVHPTHLAFWIHR